MLELLQNDRFLDILYKYYGYYYYILKLLHVTTAPAFFVAVINFSDTLYQYSESIKFRSEIVGQMKKRLSILLLTANYIIKISNIHCSIPCFLFFTILQSKILFVYTFFLRICEYKQKCNRLHREIYLVYTNFITFFPENHFTRF